MGKLGNVGNGYGAGAAVDPETQARNQRLMKYNEYRKLKTEEERNKFAKDNAPNKTDEGVADYRQKLDRKAKAIEEDLRGHESADFDIGPDGEPRYLKFGKKFHITDALYNTNDTSIPDPFCTSLQSKWYGADVDVYAPDTVTLDDLNNYRVWNEYRKLGTDKEREAFLKRATEGLSDDTAAKARSRIIGGAKEVEGLLQASGYDDFVYAGLPADKLYRVVKGGVQGKKGEIDAEYWLGINDFRKMTNEEREALTKSKRINQDIFLDLTLKAADLERMLKTGGYDDIEKGPNGRLVMVKTNAKKTIDGLSTCAPADATNKLVHLGLRRLVMVPDAENEGKFIPKEYDPENNNLPVGARRPTADEINEIFKWKVELGDDFGLVTGELDRFHSQFMQAGFTGACRSEKGPNEEDDVYLRRFTADVDTPLCNYFNSLAVGMSQREVEALSEISTAQINGSTICWQLDSDAGLASSSHVYFNGGWRFPKDADFVLNLINILRDKSVAMPGVTAQRREELANELYSKFNTLLKQAETIDKQPETIDKQLWIALAGLGLTGVFIGVIIWQRFEQKRMMEGGKKLSPEKYLEKHTRNLTADAKANNGGGYIDSQGVYKKLTVGMVAGRSPVLLGEAGVGKSAAVEGYAAALPSGGISEGEINALKKSGIDPQRVEILELMALSLQGVEGGQYRTVVEQHFRKIIEAVEKINAGGKRQILLFVDEAQVLASIGRAEGASGIMEYIKPMLARGGRIILASNNLGSLGADDAMVGRMFPITIHSTDQAETFKILKSLNIPRMTDDVIRAVMENASPTFTSDGRSLSDPRRSVVALKSFSALMAVDKPEGDLTVQDVELWARGEWGDVVRGLKDKHRAAGQEKLFEVIIEDLNMPKGRQRALEIIRLLSDPRTAQMGLMQAAEIYSSALEAKTADNFGRLMETSGKINIPFRDEDIGRSISSNILESRLATDERWLALPADKRKTILAELAQRWGEMSEYQQRESVMKGMYIQLVDGDKVTEAFQMNKARANITVEDLRAEIATRHPELMARLTSDLARGMQFLEDACRAWNEGSVESKIQTLNEPSNRGLSPVQILADMAETGILEGHQDSTPKKPGGKGGPTLNSFIVPLPFEIPETWSELAEKARAFGKNTLAGGAVFLAGEYISEAVMSAAKGDWSRLKGISAVHVLKDYGALTAGHHVGVKADKLLFQAFPSIAKIPGAQSFTGRFFPMAAAIMALNMIRGEKPTAAGTALTMGNIAVAQGITSGAWRLIEGVRAIKNGVSAVGHASKPLRLHPFSMIATVSAEFLIIKLLGELESYAFHKMALNDAKRVVSTLIAKNNDLLARMQSDPESVDAAEFLQVQMALARLQEEIAKNRHTEAAYDAAEEIKALEEKRKTMGVMDFLNFGALANPNKKLAAMREAREKYEKAVADTDRKILHLKQRSEGVANVAGRDYKKLGVPNGGVVPYAGIPADGTHVISAIPDRVVGGIYYDGVPAKTVKTNPRLAALSGDLADTWTGLSNQINRYVGDQNGELAAIAEQHASAAVASR